MMNMDCMNMRPVTVADVLSARDARVDRQRRMRLAHGLPLISFTMNIAGEIKRDEWIERAFLEGVRRIGPEQANLYACVEPLSATLFAVIWLKSNIQPMDLLGFACILLAVTLLSLRREP